MPPESDQVDAMLAAGKHLLQMITCMFDLSEIEAEDIEPQAVELDMRAVATSAST